MTIQGPFELSKFPPAVQEEMIQYLVEGNNKEDLAKLVLQCYAHEQFCSLLKEMAECNVNTGDCYNTAVLNTKLSY